jgi:tetratricopeptide (TPR) repeat protein
MSDADEARALLERAQQAVGEGRYGDAIAGFHEVVDRFGADSDPSIDALVGNALYGKGYCLQQIEREDEALVAYEQMAARFRTAGESAENRGQFSRALFQQATTLTRLERLEDALAVWDELLASFSDVREPPLAMGVAAAFEGRGAALRRLDRLDEAVEAYDDLIVRFSDSDYAVLRHRADSALSEKVFVLLLQQRYDEAIVVADAAVSRLDQADAPDALAIAVLNLGGALAGEGRLPEAIGVYDALIERLAETNDPELRARLILATNNKVEALMTLDRADEAMALHTEMLERYAEEVPRAFADAAARNAYDENAKPIVASMLLKEALALGELDHTRKALIAVNNLIDQFGDEPGEDFARMLEIARAFQKQLLDET